LESLIKYYNLECFTLKPKLVYLGYRLDMPWS
jgi:hypothetical protein